MTGIAVPRAYSTVPADVAPIDASSTIIVASSDPDLGGGIAGAMEREGFRVVRVATGREAASRLAPTAPPISLMIVDAGGPSLDGIAWAHQVVRASLDVPLILLVPDDGPRIVDATFDGVRRFLVTTPLEPHRLVALVHRLLTRTAGMSVERSVGIPLELESTQPHSAFVDVTSGADGEDPETANVVAAFLVLRHVDAWLSGTSRLDDLAAERRAARGRIRGRAATSSDRDPPTEIAIRLSAILDAVEAASTPEIGHIADHMYALGDTLANRSRYALATDAFRIVLHGVLTQPEGEANVLAAKAALRIGYCRRRLADLNGARTAYTTAGRLGMRCDVKHVCLSARLGEAIVISQLGDLGEADRRMEEIIAAAGTDDFLAVRGQALHARGTVALARGRYIDATGYLYESWTLQRDNRQERDRLMLDFAIALQNAGHRHLAKRALRKLTHPDVEPIARWNALVCLMEIAGEDGDEREFNLRREHLDRASLTPTVKGEHLYTCAIGLARFGRRDESHEALDRASEIADAHQLHDLAFRARQARETPPPPTLTELSPLPWELRRIANALFALDMLARS